MILFNKVHITGDGITYINKGNVKLEPREAYQHNLVRLPIFYDLNERGANKIVTLTNVFLSSYR